MKTIFCDDGSTAIKLAWFDDEGKIESIITYNSFKKSWNVSLNGKATYNYTVDGEQYSYDPYSPDAIKTTNIDFQYSTENLLAIHHALLESKIQPQEIELIVTLPISEFYTSDMKPNLDNIAKKKKNLLRKIESDSGMVFTLKKINVVPESLPSAANSLEQDNVHEMEVSLVVDLGGTTLDCGTIAGKYAHISHVSGDSTIGVSLVTNAVYNALDRASTTTSYLVADQLVKKHDDEELYKTLINDKSKIDDVKNSFNDAVKLLSDRVISHIKHEYKKSFNRIYLTGGGASLIYPAVKAAYPNQIITIMDDSQTALVTSIASMRAVKK